MNEISRLLNTFCGLWAESMLRASLSGGIVILLLWALCRVWPQMPPAGRSWLWRAAFCKLLLALFWQTSIGLPLLPVVSSSPVPPSVSSSRQPSHDVVPTSEALPKYVQEPKGAPDSRSENPLSEEANISSAVEQRTTDNTPLDTSAQRSFPLTSLLLACWLTGVLFFLRNGFCAWRTARQWRQSGTALKNTELAATVEELCKRFGLAWVPELRESPDIEGIALTGVWRPVILLPRGFQHSSGLREENAARIELMLAHELAHQKRHDLAWNWLLLFGQTLFWFHPLVWLAAREWRLAQEIACDALAVQVTQAPAAAYGEMLLKTALANQPESLFAIGVKGHYATLHRRLSAMKHFSTVADSKRLILCCGALAVLAQVPWSVTARSDAPAVNRSAPQSSPVAANKSQGATRRIAKISVRVQDAAKRPLRGATVVFNADMLITTDDTYVSAKTNESGLASFKVPVAPNIVRYRAWVTVYAPGYVLTKLRLDEGTSPVIQLERGVDVRGVVTDTQGRPLRGVAVRLMTIRQGNDSALSGGTARYTSVPKPLERAFTVQSDASGSWTVPGMPQSGRANFEIVDPRYYAEQFLVQLHAGGTTAARRRVIPGATITGRVRFPDGRPAAGLHVAAGGFPSRGARTGADGTYRVTGLGTTTARVSVFDLSNEWVAPVVSGLKTRRGTVTKVPDIVLTRGSLLRGRVVDAESGAPVPGAQLTAYFGEHNPSSSGNNFAFATADEQGRYTIRVLPGKGTVSATDYLPKGAGHLPSPQLPYTIGKDQTATLTVRMTPAMALEGTARDEAGNIVRDAVIVARPIGNIHWQSFRDFRSEIVDTDGKWRITHLPRKKMQLESRGAWEVISPRQVTLPVAGPVNVTVRRVVLPSLSGRVVTPDGTPIRDVEVDVIMANVRGPAQYTQTEQLGTDAQGRFQLHHLRRKVIVFLRASKPGYVFVSGGKVSAKGENIEASDIVLKPVAVRRRTVS